MMALPFQCVERVLCLGAHADDIEIGCGGALMKIAQANPGVKIHWVVFSASGPRREEVMHSIQGFSQPENIQLTLHSFEDTCFPGQWRDLKQAFAELGASADPQLIFTHRCTDRHQDHRMLGELTWNTFRNHLILEYEIPKFDGDLQQPNVFVQLDHDLVQKKWNWIHDSYKTQRAKYWFDDQTLLSLARLRGIESGRSAPFAEGFYCRKLSIQF